MSQKHLVVFSVGPVQGFIAAARKGSDLWAGSQLLSDVASAAAVAALDTGAELIMPAGDRAALLDPKAAVSNKVMAVVEGDPDAAIQEMEAAARRALKDRTDRALGLVEERVAKGAPIDFDLARSQVEDLLEVSWASVPVDLDGDDVFRLAAARVEHLLAGTRTCRGFAQPRAGSRGRRAARPKSSLDPAMESVVDDRRYRPGAGGHARLVQQLKARPGERLSGIDLVKRFWGDDLDQHRVPSTSHVASYSLRRCWEGADADTLKRLGAAVEDFKSDLRGCGVKVRSHPHLADRVLDGVDGHLLYPGRLGDLGLEGDQLEVGEAALRRLHGRFKAILGDAHRPLSPYYALLMGDGDHIGKALAVLGKDDRQRVSGWLTDFAGCAREIVAGHHGHCIYAGGDDVLAMLPSQRALQAAQDLRDAFARTVGDRLVDRLAAVPGLDRAPTFSVGVCVAHHLDPIADALDATRQAESDAKQLYGRDALCITVRKRNGAPRGVGMKWAELDGFRQMFDLLDRPGGGDALPRGLPYALRELSARVRPAGGDARSDVVEGAGGAAEGTGGAAEGAGGAADEQSDLERSLARGVVAQKRLNGPALAALQLDAPGPFRMDLLAERIEVARSLAALDGGRA